MGCHSPNHGGRVLSPPFPVFQGEGGIRQTRLLQSVRLQNFHLAFLLLTDRPTTLDKTIRFSLLILFPNFICYELQFHRQKLFCVYGSIHFIHIVGILCDSNCFIWCFSLEDHWRVLSLSGCLSFIYFLSFGKFPLDE